MSQQRGDLEVYRVHGWQLHEEVNWLPLVTRVAVCFVFTPGEGKQNRWQLGTHPAASLHQANDVIEDTVFFTVYGGVNELAAVVDSTITGAGLKHIPPLAPHNPEQPF